MTSRNLHHRLAAAAVVAAASGFVAAPAVELIGPERIGVPGVVAALSAVGMWSVLVVHVLYSVGQLLPGGRDPATGVLGVPGDAWLLALVSAMLPASAWRALSAHAPVPFGLDFLPGWPLAVGLLLVVTRVAHLNLSVAARRGRPDAAPR